MFDKVRYSRDTKLSIVLVLVGVAVCTVTDVSVNSQGLLAAVIAVWSTALQQHVSIIDVETWYFVVHISVYDIFSYLELSFFSTYFIARLLI
jgi:hypothetical protein